jgi:hypothetical protein
VSCATPRLFAHTVAKENQLFNFFFVPSTFQALFESIERDQAERGNLENDAKKE